MPGGGVVLHRGDPRVTLGAFIIVLTVSFFLIYLFIYSFAPNMCIPSMLYISQECRTMCAKL